MSFRIMSYYDKNIILREIEFLSPCAFKIKEGSFSKNDLLTELHLPSDDFV